MFEARLRVADGRRDIVGLLGRCWVVAVIGLIVNVEQEKMLEREEEVFKKKGVRGSCD